MISKSAIAKHTLLALFEISPIPTDIIRCIGYPKIQHDIYNISRPIFKTVVPLFLSKGKGS